MQVILLDRVVNLGNVGEQVNVKDGYARNYLIPQGKAIPATRKNMEYLKAYHTELETKLAEALATAEMRAAKINELGSITIASKVGNAGKLFGSINSSNIANAITIAGVNVTKSEVRLPNGALRTAGHHHVSIQVHSKVSANVHVIIIPEL